MSIIRFFVKPRLSYFDCVAMGLGSGQVLFGSVAAGVVILAVGLVASVWLEATLGMAS